MYYSGDFSFNFPTVEKHKELFDKYVIQSDENS
jgi:hypothetical protein